MDQVQDYLSKIEYSIRNSTKPIPYSLQSFYTIFKQATLKIQEKDTSIEVIGNLSKIFKFLKQYLESPHESPKDRERIFPQLKRLVAPFRKFLPIDEISKAFVANFEDISTYRKITQRVEKANTLKDQYQKRNNPIHEIGNSDFGNSFWILNFKADCAVHFSVYWMTFIELTKQYPYLQKFISDSSKKTIKGIIDPDNKFYIGMAANNQLFQQLFQPALLRQLADQTAKNEKQPLFQSTHQLKLKFKQLQPIQTILKDQDTIILSGEQILIGSQAKKCKYPPTIRFGSSIDSEIQFKHKFISRRQFMIIQQQFDFSIVCLSHSNYTSVKYPRKVKVVQGMLFKIGSQIIQVLRITQNVSFINESFSITQYENTLTHLPQNDIIKPDKILEYKILSGSRKDEKGTLNEKFSTISLDEEQMDIIVSASDDEFYLPAYTQVLLKNATQVLNGHLSDKICIQQGMTISLQEFTLTVL